MKLDQTNLTQSLLPSNFANTANFAAYLGNRSPDFGQASALLACQLH
jgi:hypothetical protein